MQKSPGQIAYEAHYPAGVHAAAWPSIRAEERARWEKSAATVIEHAFASLGKMVTNQIFLQASVDATEGASIGVPQPPPDPPPWR